MNRLTQSVHDMAVTQQALRRMIATGRASTVGTDQKATWYIQFFGAYLASYSLLVQIFVHWLMIMPAQAAVYYVLLAINVGFMFVFLPLQSTLKALVKAALVGMYHLYSPPLPVELRRMDER